MKSNEKLLKVFDFISRKDLSEQELSHLSQILRAYASVGTSSPAENVLGYIISFGWDFVPYNFFEEFSGVYDMNEAHKPVIDYLGSLPAKYVQGSPDEATGKELAALRDAVEKRRNSSIPFEEIGKLKSQFIEKTH